MCIHNWHIQFVLIFLFLEPEPSSQDTIVLEDFNGPNKDDRLAPPIVNRDSINKVVLSSPSFDSPGKSQPGRKLSQHFRASLFLTKDKIRNFRRIHVTEIFFNQEKVMSEEKIDFILQFACSV